MRRLAIPFLLVILILTYSACQTNAQTDNMSGEVEYISLKDGNMLYFPRQSESEGVQMEALLEGQVVLKDGCLRAVTNDYEAPGFLVLWPSTALTHSLDDGTIEVLDGKGEVVSRVGQPVRMGGGAMEDDNSMSFWEGQIEGMPIEGCPGPYWVAGALYPLAEPGATATTQPRATPYAQEPAAGICAEFEGSLVSVSLRPDVPDPRCVRVNPDQRLSVKNETSQHLQMSLGQFRADLDPGKEITFETPFEEYLEPGVHVLTTSAPPGGPEIWLVVESPP